MTNSGQQGPPDPNPKVEPETLELRARPQPVTRINRKVVIGAAAVTGDGVVKVFEELERHRAFLAGEDRLNQRRQAGLRARLLRRIAERAAARAQEEIPQGEVESLVAQVQSGRQSLDEAAAGFVTRWLSATQARGRNCG